MMLRRMVIVLISVAVLVLGGMTWLTYRTVEGRTAASWLAFAQRASREVTYLASGQTATGKMRADFVLQQGTGGRYHMQVTGADGMQCELGDDGERVWARNANGVTTVPRTKAASLPQRGWLVRTGQTAGQPSVTVRTQRGHVQKLVTIDRETGVILGLTTLAASRAVSRMQVTRIAYAGVAPIPPCPIATRKAMQATTVADLQRHVALTPVEPQWLPQGMRLCGRYLDWCDCCRREMAVLRYSDGVRSLTLFEANAMTMCAMGKGCHMAAGGNSLVEMRTHGRVTIIAVGDLEPGVMKRVLNSLK